MYKNKALLFIAGISLWTVFSCNDPNTVGLEVLPSNDMINVFFSDTTSLISFTVREDSLTASNTSASLAGSLIDPIFGFSRAGFFAQVVPLKISPNFGVEPQADSVVFTLDYAGQYGDTTIAAAEQTFKVYQLTQDMHKDTLYYSNDSISCGTLIGSYTFTPNKTDTTLSLKLDTAFFRTYILNQTGQTTLGSITAFQTYFKGIYVVPETAIPGNRILYFDLASTLTRLHLYYHNAVDTGVYDLAIDAKNSCATLNHFAHDYVGTPIAAQFNDSSLGATNVYVQAMAGVKTKIKMPYLSNFNKIGHIAINKAELILTTDPGTFFGFQPASQFAVQGIDSLGASVFTPDYYESLSFRGGDYNTSTGAYKTNITRYVQQVLTGKIKDNGIYIVVYGGSVFANRSVLRGSGPLTTSKIKLQITYSLLN